MKLQKQDRSPAFTRKPSYLKALPNVPHKGVLSTSAPRVKRRGSRAAPVQAADRLAFRWGALSFCPGWVINSICFYVERV